MGDIEGIVMVYQNWDAVFHAAMNNPNAAVLFDGIDIDLTDCNIPSGYSITTALNTYYVEAFGKIYWRWEMYGPYERYCVLNHLGKTLVNSMNDKEKLNQLWHETLPWKPCIRIVVEKAKEGD